MAPFPKANLIYNPNSFHFSKRNVSLQKGALSPPISSQRSAAKPFSSISCYYRLRGKIKGAQLRLSAEMINQQFLLARVNSCFRLVFFFIFVRSMLASNFRGFVLTRRFFLKSSRPNKVYWEKCCLSNSCFYFSVLARH